MLAHLIRMEASSLSPLTAAIGLIRRTPSLGRSLVILFSTFLPWLTLRLIRMTDLCTRKKFFQLRFSGTHLRILFQGNLRSLSLLPRLMLR
uniref:Peptidyl-prolyl isomerase CWC27 n=1 Tax=Arundo donax TaxID=35708 RepID=A0A0A9GE16_ARUDO